MYNKANKVTKKDALTLLTFDIEEAKKQDGESGWNPWILLVAIASLLWLLLGELAHGSVCLEKIALFYSAFSLSTWSFALRFYHSAVCRKSCNSNGRFEKAEEFLSQKRLGFYLFGLDISICFYLLHRYPMLDGHLWWHRVSMVLFGIYFLAACLILIISYTQTPLHLGQNKNRMSYLLFVFKGLIAYQALLPLTWWIKDEISVSVLSIKALCIALGLKCALIWILLSLGKRTGLLSSLKRIREDLLIGRHTIEILLGQRDIAVNGSKLSTLLQSEINAIMNELAKSINCVDEAKRIGNLISNSCTDCNSMGEDDRGIAKALLSSMASKADEGIACHDLSAKMFGNFRNKYRAIALGSDQAAIDDWEKLIDSIQKQESLLKEAVEKLRESIEETRTIIFPTPNS